MKGVCPGDSLFWEERVTAMAVDDDPHRSDASRRWVLTPTSRKPVPDLVSDRVLELVQTGALAAGERLPTEPELARHFGVARSSVRTALQRLQSDGVVEVNRGRGWFVSQEPARNAVDLMRNRMAEREFDILDVMEVRIALEGAAVALAASRATPGQLDEITKLARSHQEADPSDRGALLRTDEEFHEAIVDSSSNSYLRALYDMVTPLVAEWREQSFTTSQVHDRSALDHHQIAVLLRRRDEVGARLAMAGHLLGQYKGLARGRRSGDEVDGVASAELSTYVGVDDEPVYDT